MPEASPPFSAPRERKLIWLLCGLAAIHVFIFSAAFPVFNNVDEHPHFDIIVKYSHGNLPRGIAPLGEESTEYILTYGSPEFLGPGTNGKFPAPFWTQPDPKMTEVERRARAFRDADDEWQRVKGIVNWQNYESSEQPLYYFCAGAWWNIGKVFGLDGLQLIYWIRFLNVLFAVALVCVGYFAARIIFPDNLFMRLGVPALIAFLPQQTFYSIQNDVLSPLTFGIAFICVLKFMRADLPSKKLSVATGLALAATFLTKLINLPLLAVLVLAAVFKILLLTRGKKLSATTPNLIALFFCTGAPIVSWLVWTKKNFGDFTGTSAKIHYLTWTIKPFGQWFHHPIFMPSGLWEFFARLFSTFWQGEIWWHGWPLNLPSVSAIFVIVTICFLLFALTGIFWKTTGLSFEQCTELRFCFWLLIFQIGFFIFISVRYNFGSCIYPSQEFPYLASGRLLLGALIPFLLLFLYGIEFLLRDVKNKFVRPAVLAGFTLFMLISEIITDWSVFQSQYNWYHM
jgi:Predicted membrane protein (DUF2142)